MKIKLNLLKNHLVKATIVVGMLMPMSSLALIPPPDPAFMSRLNNMNVELSEFKSWIKAIDLKELDKLPLILQQLKIINTKDDLKRTEFAWALINHAAQSKIQDYEREINKMLMQAPGSDNTAKAMTRLSEKVNQEKEQMEMLKRIASRNVWYYTQNLEDSAVVELDVPNQLVEDKTKEVNAAIKEEARTKSLEDQAVADLKDVTESGNAEDIAAETAKLASARAAHTTAETQLTTLQTQLDKLEDDRDIILNAKLKQAGKLKISDEVEAVIKAGSLDAWASLFLETIFSQSFKLGKEQAAKIIGLLTDPFPLIDDEIAKAIREDKVHELNQQKRAKIVAKILEGSATSATNVVLSGISARRSGEHSVIRTLDQFINSRLLDANWMKNISVASEEALLRELAHIEAIITYLQFQQFKLEEEASGVSATLNSMMGRQLSVMEKSAQELEAAKKEATKQASEVGELLEEQRQREENAECPTDEDDPDYDPDCVQEIDEEAAEKSLEDLGIDPENILGPGGGIE